MTSPTRAGPRSTPSVALAIDRGHVGVAVAHRLAERIELDELVRRQLDVARGRVLLEIRAPLRARDRDDVVAPREHPGERNLRGRRAARRRDLPHPLEELHVAIEVLAREARVRLAEVPVLDLVGRAEPPG